MSFDTKSAETILAGNQTGVCVPEGSLPVADFRLTGWNIVFKEDTLASKKCLYARLIFHV